MNEIIKPRSSPKIVLATPEGDLSDDLEVATKFNKFFVDKIENLKEKIDPAYIKDPLSKIQEKVKNKNLAFSLKQVTLKEVVKIMKSMTKKKSKGNDGVSQEYLLLGLDVLAAPLTLVNSYAKEIINDSFVRSFVRSSCKIGWWRPGILIM